MTSLNAPWDFRDRVVTAFDEVGVLERMGREGWELTGFGPMVLHFRRAGDRARRIVWEHRRVTALVGADRREALEAAGWTYCGCWRDEVHYFKRHASVAGERGG